MALDLKTIRNRQDQAKSERKKGDALRNAVRSAVQENFVTPDLGGDKGTVEVGDWIAKRVGDR